MTIRLTPTPQLPLRGDEETVGGARARDHAAHRDVVQAAIAVRTPQVLAQVAEGGCECEEHREQEASDH